MKIENISLANRLVEKLKNLQERIKSLEEGKRHVAVICRFNGSNYWDADLDQYFQGIPFKEMALLAIEKECEEIRKEIETL